MTDEDKIDWKKLAAKLNEPEPITPCERGCRPPLLEHGGRRHGEWVDLWAAYVVANQSRFVREYNRRRFVDKSLLKLDCPEMPNGYIHEVKLTAEGKLDLNQA